jgi:hypothetical protein
LNKKVGSKSFVAVDFALKFIFLINLKFKIHIFYNYYEFQCKINNLRELLTKFLIQNPLYLPPPSSLLPSPISESPKNEAE